FREFWYLYLLLAVMIVLTVFVWKKAIAASAKHSKNFNENLAKTKRAKELRDAYGNLTAEIIEKAPAAPLFEGVAINLEYECQKTENTNGFYDSMTQGEKDVYALYYLISDASEGNLSSFFKSSYRPLTSDAVAAAKKILNDDISKVIEMMFNRYDENNEELSVIPHEIDRLNGEFRDLTADKDLFAEGGEYIKKNADEFLR
ncbi:MAG: hypothetical protein IIW48_11945, partial [Clostridia bacterium]|nr:hypothetical protein [Clostridia bacterium]